MVGGVDARRIVDGVSVNPPAGAGIFDAAQLRHAQIGAFAHHFGADLGAIDAHRVIGAVADIQIGLRGGFDEGADAAEPKQIDLGFQERIDQRGGRKLFRPAADQFAHFG